MTSFVGVFAQKNSQANKRHGTGVWHVTFLCWFETNTNHLRIRSGDRVNVVLH